VCLFRSNSAKSSAQCRLAVVEDLSRPHTGSLVSLVLALSSPYICSRVRYRCGVSSLIKTLSERDFSNRGERECIRNDPYAYGCATDERDQIPRWILLSVHVVYARSPNCALKWSKKVTR
jgi:hypothetical protein